jgi:hypothetical protein
MMSCALLTIDGFRLAYGARPVSYNDLVFNILHVLAVAARDCCSLSNLDKTVLRCLYKAAAEFNFHTSKPSD